MNKLAAILFLLGVSFGLSAQLNLDSLHSVWQDQSQPDTVRVEAYRQFIWKGFLYSQPDSAIVLAEELISFGKANSLPAAEAEGYNLQGNALNAHSDHSRAMRCYQLSLDIRLAIDDKKGIAGSLNNMGNVYREQGNFPKALDYYLRSLANFEAISDESGMASNFLNIGLLHFRQANYPEALEYFEKSLDLRKKQNDQIGIASAIGNIAMVHQEQGNYTQALERLDQVLEISRNIQFTNGVQGSLMSIGIIHLEMGDYDQARSFLQQGLIVQKEMPHMNGMANTYGALGTMSLELKQYEEAIWNCDTAFQISKEINSFILLEECCECLYDAYKAIGDGDKALFYHEQMLAYGDSLQSAETAKRLVAMEFQKQMVADSIANAEEAQLIADAHQEEVEGKNKTRNVLIGAGIAALLLAIGFFSRWRYVRRSKAAVEKEKAKSEGLLHNVLPVDIAAELKEKGRAEAREFDSVSILFTDFKGFTAASENMEAKDLVSEINICFEAFDEIIGKHGIEKIKTIGDAYMAAGGLPSPSNDSVKNTVLAALEMQEFIAQRKALLNDQGKMGFDMRVGIHTGPVVAGIVGVKKYQYDVWGDTVNTASRMESNGDIGKVNISQSTFELINDDKSFHLESRGMIEAKGKGEIEMYFVSRT